MKQSRFNRLIQSQSISARKVYEAVPMQEDWDSMQVNRELYRKGTNLNFTVVEGCLNTLKEAKLIKEPYRGRFIRTPVEAIPDETDEQEPNQEEVTMAAKPVLKPTPFDVLAALADRAAQLAEVSNGVSNSIIQLKADIEAAALSITEMDEKDKAELLSLRQWKSTLKNLMSE